MIHIEFSIGLDQPYETIEVEEGITAEQLYRDNIEQEHNIIFAARIDNDIQPLLYHINKECRVQLLDIRTKQALFIYQHSLMLLLLKAAADIDKSVSIEIMNSLNKGLFLQVTAETSVDEDKIAKIHNRMKQLTDSDIPIVEESRTRPNLKGSEGIRLYRIEDYSDYFYYYMAPSTGYLTCFELMKYRNGILLRYAQPESPNDIPDFVDEYMIYNAYAEQSKWNKLLGINYAEDLNKAVNEGKSLELIQLSEALHEKKIAEIADMISSQNKRIVLIAGPSSSGKTTFARRLIIQLMVNGHRPLYMGTDDYFVEREDTPRNEKGEYNFENLDALDVKLFNEQMNELLNGEEVDLPVFNFIEGKKEFGIRKQSIDSDQPIVIEGIHALNGELTNEIPDEQKFKIYVSPLTQINLDLHNRIATTDTRIIRRLVRDNKFRAHSALQTLREWPIVHAGEEKNIFPYSSEADILFNSTHTYEIAVLKKYAYPLLLKIDKHEPEYSEAVRLMRVLNFFETIEDDSAIVNNSIVREFIGGSIFA